VHYVLDAGERSLPLAAACRVLAAIGVDVVPTTEVRSWDEAAAAGAAASAPVALKAACRDAMAKTVASGLALDLADETALRSAWDRMVDRFGADLLPALVQPMVEPGVDVAITVEDHPSVGPVLTLRPGGANAALDQAVDVRVLPLGAIEAGRLVTSSRLAPYLDDAGAAHLEAVLLRLGALVEEVPEIVGLRLNPVIVTPTGATAIDVAVDVRPLDREPAPALRRI
jgi:hypothetical protein